MKHQRIKTGPITWVEPRGEYWFFLYNWKGLMFMDWGSRLVYSNRLPW